MPETWKLYAKQMLGYIPEQTCLNEETVAIMKIQQLIDRGFTDRQIAHIWNGGTVTCSSGTNKYGVPFDSCTYGDEVLKKLAYISEL